MEKNEENKKMYRISHIYKILKSNRWSGLKIKLKESLPRGKKENVSNIKKI